MNISGIQSRFSGLNKPTSFTPEKGFVPGAKLLITNRIWNPEIQNYSTRRESATLVSVKGHQGREIRGVKVENAIPEADGVDTLTVRYRSGKEETFHHGVYYRHIPQALCRSIKEIEIDTGILLKDGAPKEVTHQHKKQTALSGLAALYEEVNAPEISENALLAEPAYLNREVRLVGDKKPTLSFQDILALAGGFGDHQQKEKDLEERFKD